MGVVVVLKNLLWAVLPQRSFQTFDYMVPRLLEKRAFSLKVNDFDLLSLRVNVAVDRVIALVHDSLEVLVPRSFRVDVFGKSVTLVRQIEDLRVDLRSDEGFELTRVIPDLLPAKNQDRHVDE